MYFLTSYRQATLRLPNAELSLPAPAEKKRVFVGAVSLANVTTGLQNLGSWFEPDKDIYVVAIFDAAGCAYGMGFKNGLQFIFYQLLVHLGAEYSCVETSECTAGTGLLIAARTTLHARLSPVSITQLPKLKRESARQAAAAGRPSVLIAGSPSRTSSIGQLDKRMSMSPAKAAASAGSGSNKPSASESLGATVVFSLDEGPPLNFFLFFDKQEAFVPAHAAVLEHAWFIGYFVFDETRAVCVSGEPGGIAPIIARRAEVFPDYDTVSQIERQQSRVEVMQEDSKAQQEFELAAKALLGRPDSAVGAKAPAPGPGGAERRNPPTAIGEASSNSIARLQPRLNSSAAVDASVEQQGESLAQRPSSSWLPARQPNVAPTTEEQPARSEPFGEALAVSRPSPSWLPASRQPNVAPTTEEQPVRSEPFGEALAVSRPTARKPSAPAATDRPASFQRAEGSAVDRPVPLLRAPMEGSVSPSGHRLAPFTDTPQRAASEGSSAAIGLRVAPSNRQSGVETADDPPRPPPRKPSAPSSTESSLKTIPTRPPQRSLPALPDASPTPERKPVPAPRDAAPDTPTSQRKAWSLSPCISHSLHTH